MTCPKCGEVSPDSAQFCLHCHNILIHRCPKCWHEQRPGGNCEKCGTNFALYWELEFERSVEEANHLWWDRLKSGVSTYIQFLLVPFSSLFGILRLLIMRFLSLRFSNR
jgi:hypothetical protein